jgi:hypothetical protein
MTFHPLVWIIILAWVYLLGNEYLANFSISNFRQNNLFGLFLTFAPIIFGIPVFFYEVNKAKKLLDEVFELNKG